MSETFWGWMAVLGRFMSSFVYMGTSKALGVLIPHLVVQLNSSEGNIGLCSSLFAGLSHVAGPAATALVNRYGVRKVIMLGGSLTCLCVFSSALSTGVVHLGISLALAGLGNGLCMVVCIMPLTWYFPDRFALVNSISASGGALGMTLLPPITERFVNLYGWRGALALLAALSSHSVLSGAIVKQPAQMKYTQSLIQNQDNFTTSSGNEHSERKHPIKDVFRNVAHIIYAQIFSIYPVFIGFQLMFLIFGTGFAAWVLFLVPDSLKKGIASSAAAFLSTIGGVGHIIGRLVQGILVDWEVITDLQLYGVMSMLCAISFIADPWLSDYLSLAISAFNVGFATGAQYTLSLSMTKRIITRNDLLLAAMGWTHLFIGVGKIAGGPLVGYLQDATGEYTASFLTLGGLEIGLIILIITLEIKHRS